MMNGYLDEPGATRAVFDGGWFHTGDLGRVDEEGFLYLVGRAKDMIRRSGENVSAFEVEQAVERHPGVELAACVAVPDDVRGEEVKVYVVLKDPQPGPELLEAGLIEHCAGLLARFKVPRYWEYRSGLPLTQSNKVAKSVLVAESEDPRAGSWDAVERVWR